MKDFFTMFLILVIPCEHLQPATACRGVSGFKYPLTYLGVGSIKIPEVWIWDWEAGFRG